MDGTRSARVPPGTGGPPPPPAPMENMTMTTDPPAVTVGVDFGTLSGRALVVAVDDGRELGSAVHEYRHGVVDGVLPATGRRLPPDWALQIPGD